MRALTKDAVERFALGRTIPFNVSTLCQRVDYFCELVRLDRADGLIVIALPL